MPETASVLIDRTRRFMGDFPDVDALTASVASGGTTLSVAATASDTYHVNQIIQIGQEALRVDAVPSSVSLTVTRAVWGTTATSHASSATIMVSPRFINQEYLDALNYAIQATWPWIYRPVVDDSITFATDTYEYVIPQAGPRQELDDDDARFEGGVGSWAAQSSNTFAVNSTVAYEGYQSARVTYQDNTTLATTGFTARASVPHAFSMQIYVPSTWDGGTVYGSVRDFGAAADQVKGEADMSKTDEWQKVAWEYTPPTSDLVGAVAVACSSAPTAGRFFYIDDVFAGRDVGELRHIAQVSVKVPGDDRFIPRRRWSVRRGLESMLVFRNQETNGSAVRLNGFGPFPGFRNSSDILDPQYPSQAVTPLVEFAASYLLESGEARRVAQDRGLADQREQANRVGASMQASQAILSRFERRLQMIGMPPLNGYPHVQPWP